MERHRHVREEVATWVGLVGTDPTHLRGEVQHHIGSRVAVEACGGFLMQEVVVASARDDDVGHAASAQAFDHCTAEEASAAGDDDTGADEGRSGVRSGHGDHD